MFCFADGGSTGDSLLLRIFSGVRSLAVEGSPTVMKHVVSVVSSSLIVHGTFRDLFVLP